MLNFKLSLMLFIATLLSAMLCYGVIKNAMSVDLSACTENGGKILQTDKSRTYCLTIIELSNLDNS